MYDRSANGISEQLNTNYKNDIHYTLQMCQWLLKPLGIWPVIYKRTSQLEKLIAFILFSMCFFTLLFIIVPCCNFIFSSENSIHVKVKLLGPVSFSMTSAMKYCYFGLKGQFFERCIEHVERDWKTVQDPNHRGIMLKYVTISRNMIIVCAIFLYTGGMSHHTVEQFLSKERSKSNNTVRPLAYPGYDAFFDVQSSPTYEIVFFLHCSAAMVTHTVATGAYSLAAIFVTHICGQIQINITRLQELVKKVENNDVTPDPLAIIIHDHVEIIKFARNVEEALREICLIQIIESTVNMCMLEYYCLSEWRNSDAVAIVTYSTLLISFTFNIFIFCYIGEVLFEQCTRIGVASYEIEWYNLPAKRAHDLILLNVISQNPPILTAGKIIELSLTTFSTVVKTSVVYFNLLRTFTE
ncbi:odorant receptor 9a-like [Ceratina calcarata]|uniref:Odorant receptor n=1 Tax=Ceratina calcarata TaxID=156304 RepID=A0AAJ7IWN6_9HYME|nr:odorant receptor 9a-like [Ceratina calcarata]